MVGRQNHTIISQELIKPSSPTPSHLRLYNLSEFDQHISHNYVPLIFYYPNDKSCSLTPDDKVRKMKASLSQSLSQYHPFAGRVHSPTSTYTLCNDEGVVFVEARHNSQMNMSQHIDDDDDVVGQLFVDDLSWWQHCPSKRTNLLGVQVNHFACGGIAVAVAMSHIIGDASTFGSLVSHWASVARYGSLDHKDVIPFNPQFFQYHATTSFHAPPPEGAVLATSCINPVTRKFVFPNSKLKDLKNKVLAMSALSINKPTRVEVLTSLIYKTWAAGFKKSILLLVVNVRNKFVPKQPQTAVGNFGSFFLVMSKHVSEAISLKVLVSNIQKGKMELECVKSQQLARDKAVSDVSRLSKEEDYESYKTYMCTSLCGFPFNKVDFGWGNPVVASLTLRPEKRVGCSLMDTPNGDGIEAWVTLDKQDMERLQNDKELLSFRQN
ncbi:akuammiline synthase 1-like [Bidens hawaiensis]|uniref:akuammiline synthase 1-like n=1 Tax=Bidens hawaiensis TaxID=980011 RepID=UPI00404A4FBC